MLVPWYGMLFEPSPEATAHCTLQSKDLVPRGERLSPRLLFHVYGKRSDRPADWRIVVQPCYSVSGNGQLIVMMLPNESNRDGW